MDIKNELTAFTVPLLPNSCFPQLMRYLPTHYFIKLNQFIDPPNAFTQSICIWEVDFMKPWLWGGKISITAATATSNWIVDISLLIFLPPNNRRAGAFSNLMVFSLLTLSAPSSITTLSFFSLCPG